jgi:signal transduction histidine kinase
MKSLQTSLMFKIAAFLGLYLSICAMLVSGGIVLYGENMLQGELYLLWPFSWFWEIANAALPLAVIINILLFAYLLGSAGVTAAGDKIELNAFDRIYGDVLTAFAILLGMLGLIPLHNLPIVTMEAILVLGLLGFYYYSIVMLWCITITKRLRTDTLFTNTFIYRLFVSVREIFRHLGDVYRVGAAVILFGIINAMLLISLGWLPSSLLFFLFNGAVFFLILQLTLQFSKLKTYTNQIAAGQLAMRVNSQEFSYGFRELADSLNAISSGLQKALEEQMRSERLKTELITNVSHDIKTPLTSIINYVDLLQKEDFENKKAAHYLAVLTQKSQRLKELIEDLLEVSKASTGNISVDLTDINVNELLKQITGEYADRLQERNLQVIQNLPREKVLISADRRHMSRILENLFSNIRKHALPQTRVYLDLVTQPGSMRLTMKNISAEELNIPAEELMERFVRGDQARHSEGSGLGLAIARSLTELQGGGFNIEIIGDLFVVELSFPLADVAGGGEMEADQ